MANELMGNSFEDKFGKISVDDLIPNITHGISTLRLWECRSVGGGEGRLQLDNGVIINRVQINNNNFFQNFQHFESPVPVIRSKSCIRSSPSIRNLSAKSLMLNDSHLFDKSQSPPAQEKFNFPYEERSREKCMFPYEDQRSRDKFIFPYEDQRPKEKFNFPYDDDQRIGEKFNYGYYDKQRERSNFLHHEQQRREFQEKLMYKGPEMSNGSSSYGWSSFFFFLLRQFFWSIILLVNIFVMFWLVFGSPYDPVESHWLHHVLHNATEAIKTTTPIVWDSIQTNFFDLLLSARDFTVL